MKEILSFFIGQGGIQLSSAIWEMFCAEHGVTVDGDISVDDMLNDGFNGLSKFFFPNSQNKAIPRCLLIDLEPSVTDEIQQGTYKQLFTFSNFVTGKEDAASIFSRGYFSQGRYYLNSVMTQLQTLLESADNAQGVLLVHSLGGGTGSGMYSLLLEEMDSGCLGKMMRFDLAVHPCFPGAPILVEPYNSVLAMHYTVDEAELTYLVDNAALFRLAYNRLNLQRPTYVDINRLVAQTFATNTSAIRFGSQSATLNEFMHNLVPYPRIHFPTSSLAPLIDRHSENHCIDSVFYITKEALSGGCQLLSCDPAEGKYMACCLTYRGSISSGDICNSVHRLKSTGGLRFVDWCPTGVKVTLCNKEPVFIDRSGIGVASQVISIVSNNSAITDALLHNTFRFQVLFQKRAFVHWYVGEGMEEDEFKDSLENIACLIKDYEECSLSNKILNENLTNEESHEENSEITTEVTPNTLSDKKDKQKLKSQTKSKTPKSTLDASSSNIQQEDEDLLCPQFECDHNCTSNSTGNSVLINEQFNENCNCSTHQRQ